MITVTEADQLIQANLPAYPAENRSLEKCYGAILREEIIADRDAPPFNRALVDGIAISFDDWSEGARKFSVIGTQAAADNPVPKAAKTSAVHIMTGAALDASLDAVIPIEDVKVMEKVAYVEGAYSLKRFAHIQKQGTYHSKDKVLLKPGRVLLPPQLSVCASVGRCHISVSRRLKAAVVTTGDELVAIDQSPSPYQVRQSNLFFIKAALENSDLFETHTFPLPDHKKTIEKEIQRILDNFDVVICSGGVSMGKFDHIPGVMRDLGVNVIFHKVRQKPGKPMWFGLTESGKAVFALPGNPVSTQIGLYRYVFPQIKKALQAVHFDEEHAILKENFDPNTEFTYFLPVRINCNDLGQLIATPVPFAGSGDLASLGKTDGFIELPENEGPFSSGFKARLYRWHENH